MSIRMFVSKMIQWQSDEYDMCINYLRVEYDNPMTIGWVLVTHWMRVIYSMTIGWQLDAHRMTIGCALNTHLMSIVGFMRTGWQSYDDSMLIVWQSNTHRSLWFWFWLSHDDCILIEWQLNHHTFIIDYWMTIGYSSIHHYLMMSIQWQSSVHNMLMVFL